MRTVQHYLKTYQYGQRNACNHKLGECGAGMLKLELIAWDAQEGPLETHSRPFILHPLQSKELLVVLQDELLTYRRHGTKPRHPHSQPVQTSLLQHTTGLSWTQHQLASSEHQEALEYHTPDSLHWHADQADEAGKVSWPGLTGNDTGAMNSCPPGECFLRITAVLDTAADDADIHSRKAAADCCAQAAAAKACGSMPGLIAGDGRQQCGRKTAQGVGQSC